MNRKDIIYISFIIALATVSLVNFFFNNLIVAGVATAVTLGLYGFVILVGWFFFFRQTTEEEYAALTRTGGRLSDLSDKQLRKMSKESLRKAIRSRKKIKILGEFVENLNRDTSSQQELNQTASRAEVLISEPGIESADVTSSPTSVSSPTTSSPVPTSTAASTPASAPAPAPAPATPATSSPPTPTLASSTPLVKFASVQAQNLAVNLTIGQLIGLTPSSTRGFTVADISSIVSSSP